MSTARRVDNRKDVTEANQSKMNHPNNFIHEISTIPKTTLNYDRKYYQSLLKRVNFELKSIQYHQPSSSSLSSSSYDPSNHSSKNNNNILQEAHEIASKVGLSIESDLRNINIVTTTTAATTNAISSTITPKEPLTTIGASLSSSSAAASSTHNIPISTTTGGYSNTDHIITQSGLDDRTDRINEYRRQYMIRQRTVTNSETKLYTQKWDKHRVMGERRRRIVRDIDLPNAPIEPPPSGYIIFLGQMTTKLRHDSFKRNQTNRIKHDQTKMVQEISNMWKSSLNDNDREYYHNFYVQLKKEYLQQLMEYRSTGYYTPSTKYIRNHVNVGLWTHIETHEKNALELEIATYDTIQFPSTHLDEEERLRRIRISKEKRKLKIQQQRDELIQKQQEQLPNVGLSLIKRRRRRRQSSIGSTTATETDVMTSDPPPLATVTAEANTELK